MCPGFRALGLRVCGGMHRWGGVRGLLTIDGGLFEWGRRGMNRKWRNWGVGLWVAVRASGILHSLGVQGFAGHCINWRCRLVTKNKRRRGGGACMEHQYQCMSCEGCEQQECWACRHKLSFAATAAAAHVLTYRSLPTPHTGGCGGGCGRVQQGACSSRGCADIVGGGRAACAGRAAGDAAAHGCRAGKGGVRA